MKYTPLPDNCYHCNQEFLDEETWPIVINHKEQHMCCPGCFTVAQMLIDNGLTDYYELRTEAANKPDSTIPEVLKQLETYKQYDLLQEHVEVDGSISQIDLAIDGITCAACAWVIERRLMQLKGTVRAQVNAVTRRLALHWNQKELDLNRILGQISSMGFKAFPYQESLKKERFQENNRQWLLRIGVAALCTMQVMMISIGLYLGYGSDLSSTHQHFMRWVSAALTFPVISFAARPFIQAAWASLKLGQPGIDVPVSIAIVLAYVASIYLTITNGSEVYFDSICMFTLFLLLGRYLEHHSRFKMAIAGQYFQQWIPQQVLKVDTNLNTNHVPLQSIVKDDIICVSEGDVIPVDGNLINERASIDQAFLTGEFHVITKKKGEKVLAGSVNTETPIQIRVEKVGQATQWAELLRLQLNAEQAKPSTITLLDSVARWFVFGVLLVAVSVAAYWWQVEPENVLPITLSVLIISCPCALSLAAPTTFTCATKRLSDLGVMVLDCNWIENLTRVKHIVFDKTGTVTDGKLSIKQIRSFDGYSTKDVAAIASALEQGGNHPVAVALSKLSNDHLIALDRRWVTGCGCYGSIDGRRYYLGKGSWLTQECQLMCDTREFSGVYLVVDNRLIGHFEFSDRVRTGIDLAISDLHKQGYKTHLLSGDANQRVEALARQIGFTKFTAEATPSQKLDYIEKLQADLNQVMMVGDGLNDAAVLSKADVSLAMGGGVTHAKESAGAILSSNRLDELLKIIDIAKQSKRIVKQNIAWAIGYNILAIPFAAIGWVPPWLAAIGMTLSSILVTLNALRLLKYEPSQISQSEPRRLVEAS